MFSLCLPLVANAQFTSWDNYKYFWVGFQPNEWDARNPYKSDTYNHVKFTKATLLQHGLEVLPNDLEYWPPKAKANMGAVLCIDLYQDGVCSVVWRYSTIDQMTSRAKTKVNSPEVPSLLKSRHYDCKLLRMLPDNHSVLREEWKESVSPWLSQYQFTGSLNEASDHPRLDDFNMSDLKSRVERLQPTNSVFGLYRGAPFSHESCPPYKFAVIDGEQGISAYITEDLNNWKKGELKGVLTPTASPNVFVADWYSGNKSKVTGYAEVEGGMLTILMEGGYEEGCPYIKTHPVSTHTPSAVTNSNSESPARLMAVGSGSSVVIDAANGYLVTNHHVASAGTQLRVMFQNEEYDVVVVALDEANDLALLRINSPPSGLKGLPISINDGLGDEIVTAGYPLKGVLGSDIKVTEGIISSTSYLGSSNMYQISAPITNGSSGGALLDKSGNLAGITQGGFRPDENTENVNSAVKSLMILALTQGQPNCVLETGDRNNQIQFSSLHLSVLPVNVYE